MSESQKTLERELELDLELKDDDTQVSIGDLEDGMGAPTASSCSSCTWCCCTSCCCTNPFRSKPANHVAAGTPITTYEDQYALEANIQGYMDTMWEEFWATGVVPDDPGTPDVNENLVYSGIVGGGGGGGPGPSDGGVIS
jgi:hypothetical protein